MKVKLLQIRRMVVCLLVLISMVTSAWSEDRGKFSYAYPPARTIQESVGIVPEKAIPQTEIAPPVFHQKFVSSVGGISFFQIATPGNSVKNKIFDFQYDRNKPDGERFSLQLNGKKLGTLIYDWILIPVANFAESEHHSCFTYFGRLMDDNLEKTVLDTGGHILNYHPAFQNQLLGWRLADMDMLILYDFTTDLPRVNNRYILGAGEKIPDLNANNTGAYLYSNYIHEIERDLGYSFQSYIITDYSRQVVISVLNDSLKLSGYPYYYCWKYRYSEPGFDINALISGISNKYEETIRQEAANNQNFNKQDFYIDSLLAVARRYEGNFNIFQSGTFNEMLELKSDTERKDFLSRFQPESIGEMAMEITAQMEAHAPLYLKAYSDRMSAHPEMIRAFNPAIWEAAVQTMRYAAFFRYLKMNNPDKWNSFIQAVRDLETVPRVKTPTVIYDKDNAALKKIFN